MAFDKIIANLKFYCWQLVIILFLISCFAHLYNRPSAAVDLVSRIVAEKQALVKLIDETVSNLISFLQPDPDLFLLELGQILADL